MSKKAPPTRKPGKKPRSKPSKYGGKKNKNKYNKETRPPRFSKVKQQLAKTNNNEKPIQSEIPK